jgi:hypothetical protein
MLTEKGNSFKDYYKILGLEEEASLEEITARWLEFKKQFQFSPEKHNGADKQIREINEAYRILKASVPPLDEFSLEKYLKEGALARKDQIKAAKEKMIIFSSSILAICLIGGAAFFILTRSPGTVQLPSTTQADPNRIARGSIEQTTALPPLESKTPVMIAKIAPQEPSKTAISEGAPPVPTAKESPSASSLKTTLPVEVARVVPQEPSKTAVPEAARPVPASPPALKPAPPVEVAKVVPQEPSKTTAPPLPSGPPSEGEVRQFLGRYINSYNNKSIDGLISFFSPKAIQNQKDDLDKIRKIYDKFFDQMETVQYQIAINKIEPQQSSVEVKGQYQLEGVALKGSKKYNWKGQIRWVLVRENGALKILSLDYQP